MATDSKWSEQARRPRTPAAPQLELPRAEPSRAEGGRSSADAFIGTARVVIPIPLPAARGAPTLSLVYSQGLENGPFGLGFGLDVPSIARASARVPRYDDGDVFMGPDGEELTPGLRLRDGVWEAYEWTANEDGVAYDVRVYRARTDAGDERIERWRAPDGMSFWKVRDDRGGTAVYGRSADTRITDPRAPARVARWLLEQEIDALGNLVRYTYAAEDGAGWDGWEPPGGFAQRYPASIRFATYESGAGETFAFEVIFDYGQLDPVNSIEPVRPWPVRADPLMSCRSGFPIQTLRLCRNIVVVNRIPEAGAPHATSILELGYEEDPVHTRLTSAQLVGVRGQGDDAETAVLPALELGYAAFDSGNAEWRPITIAGAAGPPVQPGHNGRTDVLLADLHSEGLSGLLVTGAETPLYCAPLGNGVMAEGRPIDPFPDVGDGGSDPRVTWEDVEGNGHLSVVVLTDSTRGFFYGTDDGWQPYRPFGALPEEAMSSNARWIDVDGDGRADVVVQLPAAVRCHVDEGTRGFGPPLTAPAPSGFPELDDYDERSVVLFGDVLGDGLAHCVRVRDGAVEVWLNLGYGRFAEPYAMDAAPALGPELTTDRILLADLTGSGRADLVLLYPDRVEVYRNRSGVGFLPAVIIQIPGGLDPLDRVSVSDVDGTGLNSLVIAQAGAGGPTNYLRIGSHNPSFLLTDCTNGMGATTSFSYRSSTDFYIADRAAGRPWATRLASPVTVVDWIEHRDAVAKVRTVSTRQYRDGWFDPVERVFRGFGSVQSQDAIGLNPDLWSFSDGESPTPGARLVRQWFDIGRTDEAGRLRRRFRAEQFDPGPDGIEAGLTAMLPPIADGSGRTLREAAAAATGRLWHTETYAIDDDGLPEAVPLAVEDHAYAIELVQPAEGHEYGSFRVLGRESVATDYEGIAEDPRVEYDALLDWDAYGVPTAWAAVFYARRDASTPAQGELRAILHEQAHITIDDASTFVTGLTWDDCQSELGGLHPPETGAFSYAAMAEQVALARTPANRVPYGLAFTGGPQARACNWAQTVFWDDAVTEPAPLGEAGGRGLVHHHREAVFPSGFPERVYGGRVDHELLTAEARIYEDAGYWWQDGPVVSYLGPGGFFQPRSFRTPFQSQATATTARYDEPYFLFSVEVTDGYGFKTTARPDYEAMEPGAVTDVNGVVTQGIYDPLRRLMAMAQHAKLTTGYVGDMDLANYVRLAAPTVDELVAEPGRYLQGARMYVLHGLAARDSYRTPAVMATVQATAYAGEPQSTRPAAPPLVTVTHLDGFGRTLEAVQRVEGAAAASDSDWVWASTSRVDYDDQGRILRSYLPAFLPTWRFAEAGARPFSAFKYDALDRMIREDDPKGFFTKTTNDDAWTTRYYDEDDTVTESRYYMEHINDPTLPAAERRALEMAATFSDTPLVTKRDAQGFVVEEDGLNVVDRRIVANSTRFVVDIRGLVTAIADPRHTPEHPNVTTEFDMIDRPVHAVRADAGETFLLHDAMERIVHRWTGRGAAITTSYDDVMRRPIQENVVTGGETNVTKTFTYGDGSGVLSVNRLVRVDDQAGRYEIAAYDLLGEVANASWRFARQVEGTIDWGDPAGVDLLDSTWTCRWERDPTGLTVAEYCADGSVLRHSRYVNGWLQGAGIDGASPAAVSGSTYLAGGQLVATAYQNGVRLALDRDPLTLEIIRARAMGPRALQDLAYTFDPVGNVCTIEDRAAATILGGDQQPLVKEFHYDALYRLRDATGWESARGTPPWRPYEDSYTYDDAGNLLGIDHSVDGTGEMRSFTVAPTSNRAVLTSMIDPTHPVDAFFDASGNLLSDEVGQSFSYDYDEHLATAAAAATTAWYRYDGDGIRRQRRVSTGTDTTDVYRVGSTYIVAGPANTAFAVLCRGDADDLFLAERPSLGRPPMLRYFVPDRLGSVTVQVDADGELLQYEDFLPYGAVSVTAGAGSPPPVMLGFAGKERDPEASLDYFGARYYKPTWGRWLTPDPLGEDGGLNLYAYVDGNPVTAYDAHGYGRSKVLKWAVKPFRKLGFGKVGAKFLQAGFGGDVLTATLGKRGLTAYRWRPQATNTGVGISRKYPVTSKGYRVLLSNITFIQRVTRSMFKASASHAGLMRGHGIPHADTMVNTPASGGLFSTLTALNYYPELEGWGEQQRKHREGKARNRGTPIVHVNEYGPNPKRTLDGTPVPERLWFVELTALSTEPKYAGSKKYTAKAYKIEYQTFDYDALPPAKPGSDRRALKSQRVKALPKFVHDFVTFQTKLPNWFKLKL